MDLSSFALFELDAKQCKIGLWRSDRVGNGPLSQQLATIAPILAAGSDGDWLLGEAALARRLLAPEACILDILEPESPKAWASRARVWPFASPVLDPERGVCWDIEDRRYPRSYLLSRLLVHARELAENEAQQELRSMALVAGRTVSPALREDLEQAAKLAGVTRLWWVDRMQALARSIQARSGQAQLPVAKTVATKAQDGQDALRQIDEVLGVAGPNGPTTAQLSHAEFAPAAPVPDVVSNSAQEPTQEPQEPQEPAQDSQAPQEPDALIEAQETEALTDPGAPASQDDPFASAISDQASIPTQGQWIWVADQMGLELAQVSLEPELALHARSLIWEGAALPWQAKVVAELYKDLEEGEQLSLDESRMAQVRIWDACGKMMDRLASQAQTELHLPHLCVHKDQSYHYQATWQRKRMDALIADAIRQLKACCLAPESSGDEEPQPGEPNDERWQWGRYGSASEMPAFVRVAQQCAQLVRKDAKLPGDSALVGAGIWIEERQGPAARNVAEDVMTGDLEWEHPSGFRKRMATHGQTLPIAQDFDLQGAQIDPDDASPWSLYLCLAGAQEEQEQRRCVTRVVISDYATDARVRMQVHRNAKIVVSRSPAAKNAGAQDLVEVSSGLSSAQMLDLEIDQLTRDVDRFVAMRCQAMRKDLAKHSADLGAVLLERGDKMDDLLRTRLGEWVRQSKETLTAPVQEECNKPALAELTPVHDALLQMIETFTPAQKKSLAVEVATLPELMDESDDKGMPSGTRPWWNL